MTARLALVAGGDGLIGRACGKHLRRLGYRVVDECSAGEVRPNLIVACPRGGTTIEGALDADVVGPLRLARDHQPEGPDATFVLVGLADADRPESPEHVAAPARARLLGYLVDVLGPHGVRVVHVEPGAARPATIAAVIGWLLDPADSRDGPPVLMLGGETVSVERVASEYGLDG